MSGERERERENVWERERERDSMNDWRVSGKWYKCEAEIEQLEFGIMPSVPLKNISFYGSPLRSERILYALCILYHN
jgi:hypothetical protein